MKNLLLLLAAALLLSGCQTNTAPSVDPLRDAMEAKGGEEVSATEEKAPAKSIYRSELYGFNLTLPDSWGGVKANNIHSPVPFGGSDGEKMVTIFMAPYQAVEADQLAKLELAVAPASARESLNDIPMKFFAAGTNGEGTELVFYYQPPSAFMGMPGVDDENLKLHDEQAAETLRSLEGIELTETSEIFNTNGEQ